VTFYKMKLFFYFFSRNQKKKKKLLPNQERKDKNIEPKLPLNVGEQTT